MTASAWVEGDLYYAASEHAINVVAATRRIYLPILMTYPPPQATLTPLPTTTPAAAAQLLRNGGFEDAAPLSPPWRQYDRADPRGLLVSDFWARSGTWSAWMGGVYSDEQEVYQTLSVPA